MTLYFRAGGTGFGGRAHGYLHIFGTVEPMVSLYRLKLVNLPAN
jgi:hypothetical protein